MADNNPWKGSNQGFKKFNKLILLLRKDKHRWKIKMVL